MAADAKIIIGVDPAKKASAFTIADWVKMADSVIDVAKLRPTGKSILRAVQDSKWGVTPSDVFDPILASLPYNDRADAFRYSYMQDFQSISRLNRQEVDYEKAFWLALEETAYDFDGDEWPLVDPVRLLDSRYSPQFLDRWMWGPHGEFVALARVSDLDLPAQKAAMDGAGEFVYSNRSLGGTVHLHVTPLGMISNIRQRFQALFIRFADYRSVAIWRASAERQSDHARAHGADEDRQIRGRRADRVVIDEFSMMKQIDRKAIDALFAPGGV